MGPTANVRAIDALDKLSSALKRFSVDIQESLVSVFPTALKVTEWLQGRLAFWRGEVKQRRLQVQRAAAMLEACQASPFFSDCRIYQNTLYHAQRRLAEAEVEADKAQEWLQRVRQAMAEYQSQAKQLSSTLANELPRATAFLGRSVDFLEAYVAIDPSSAVDIGPATSSTSTMGNTEVASLSAFRDRMETMSNHERGMWGEAAAVNEARMLQHRILLAHRDVTTPGYDCVSWDGQNLHIWEAKNYSAKSSDLAGIVRDLGALDVRKRLTSVAQFLLSLTEDDSERVAIGKAIQVDQVQWHIRLGPDTDIAFAPLEELDWGSVEVQRYDYEYMLGVFKMIPSYHTETGKEPPS
jgi:hypothetical protein